MHIVPTREPVTIKMIADEGTQAYLKTLMPAFHKQYAHITVEFVRPGSQFNPPQADIFAISPFAWRFIRERLAVLDLSPYITADEKFNRDE